MLDLVVLVVEELIDTSAGSEGIRGREVFEVFGVLIEKNRINLSPPPPVRFFVDRPNVKALFGFSRLNSPSVSAGDRLDSFAGVTVGWGKTLEESVVRNLSFSADCKPSILVSKNWNWV
jgi:hypothetical protein